ncbi:hypothetical protein VNO77_00717 [Canavalia gladiata]|uniref:Uncharacterized protein n=1 Tax=Canavalia gladiata TaxID=3824 RepID=A0AAN9MWF5_CANGL
MNLKCSIGSNVNFRFLLVERPSEDGFGAILGYLNSCRTFQDNSLLQYLQTSPIYCSQRLVSFCTGISMLKFETVMPEHQ